MKKPYMILLAGMALGLAGCAGTADRQELSQQTVEYGCGPGGEQPLTVQYTFRGDEAVSARLIYMTQAIDMTRVTAGNADMVGNTFRGGGHTWVTGKFTRDNVDEVNGDMLTRDATAAGVPAAGGMGGYAGTAQGGYAGTGQAGQTSAAHGAMAMGGQPDGVGTVVARDCRVE